MTTTPIDPPITFRFAADNLLTMPAVQVADGEARNRRRLGELVRAMWRGEFKSLWMFTAPEGAMEELDGRYWREEKAPARPVSTKSDEQRRRENKDRIAQEWENYHASLAWKKRFQEWEKADRKRRKDEGLEPRPSPDPAYSIQTTYRTSDNPYRDMILGVDDDDSPSELVDPEVTPVNRAWVLAALRLTGPIAGDNRNDGEEAIFARLARSRLEAFTPAGISCLEKVAVSGDELLDVAKRLRWEVADWFTQTTDSTVAAKQPALEPGSPDLKAVSQREAPEPEGATTASAMVPSGKQRGRVSRKAPLSSRLERRTTMVWSPTPRAGKRRVDPWAAQH